MISFLVADIVEIFYTVLLPFIRISAMLIVAPVLSMDSVTVKIRIIIAIALTIAIYPVLDWPVIDPVSGDGLIEIFHQALLGICLLYTSPSPRDATLSRMPSSA